MIERIFRYVLVFLIGLLLGTVGTFSHQSVVRVGSADLPWGMIVALLGVACYLVGIRLVLGGRGAVLVAAIGLLVPIAVFTLPGPGGYVIVPAGVLGELWEYAPAIIAVLVLAWPRLPARTAVAGHVN